MTIFELTADGRSVYRGSEKTCEIIRFMIKYPTEAEVFSPSQQRIKDIDRDAVLRIEEYPVYGVSAKVIQLDQQGNIMAGYSTISEAERVTGIDDSSISEVMKGKRITAGGFRWRKS